MALGHSVTIDGLLDDWLGSDRIDDASNAGYRINATSDATNFYFSLTAPTIVGANTTVWLNTDRNAATGFQVFGFAGGAEYNVNFASDGTTVTAALYSGGAGETLIASGLPVAWSADGLSVEFSIPKATIGNPAAIDTLYDINDSVFLPSSYSSTPYTVFNDTGVVPAADTRIGIVYSDTTAKAFFSETAYAQLFMSVQSQAMQAGIPFDILTEADLTNLETLSHYDALVFPSFRNVNSGQVNAIANTLQQAIQQFDIGLVVAGEFMTNDQNNNAIAGDSYARMKLLLDIGRVEGGTAGASVTVNATDPAHMVLDGYSNGQVIESYGALGWNAFSSVSGTGTTIATETIDGTTTHAAVLATQTGGRNVHFATEGIMADGNMLQHAIDYAVTGNQLSVGLQLSRQSIIVATRVDMDQSQEVFEVNPGDGSRGIYDIFNPVINNWKQNYNFVGSYYVNVGNNPPDQTTDWNVSLPYYRRLINLGGEIATHSYTHPENTNLLTAAQLQFEFQNSAQVLEQQLSAFLNRPYNITGAALPGAPETLSTALAIMPYVDRYITGGYAGTGAGYPNAFGFLSPTQQDKVYFAPNTVFDFTLIEFQHKTIAQAEAAWAAEWADLVSFAETPIVLWPIHDYGVAAWNSEGASPYQTSMFTNWVARAAGQDSEFVTLDDLAQRIQSMSNSSLTTSISGNIITATVAASNAGKFALDVDGQGSSVIQNVAGWYAYDNDSVYLPASGGTFTITLGAAQDDVTHITELPMRASLLSVSGNGTNLAFSVVGEGRLVVDLNSQAPGWVQVSGASVVSRVGDILTLDLGTGPNTTRNVSVAIIDGVAITSNGGGDAASINAAENGLSVTTVTAQGVNGAVGISYAITSGDDSALFSLNPATGVLVFNGAPDFETPGDADHNNSYLVNVTATDAEGHSDTQLLTVNVTNVGGISRTTPIAGGTLSGTGEEDTLNGRAGNDFLYGLAGADTLNGAGGNDLLDGGADADILIGGQGVDDLTGGSGADIFRYTGNGQSGALATTRDIIRDFEQGFDRIDLAQIDANTATGRNDSFTLIDQAAFTARGQLRYSYQFVGTVEYTVIEGNNAGTLAADFSIALQGHHTPLSTDFFL